MLRASRGLGQICYSLADAAGGGAGGAGGGAAGDGGAAGGAAGDGGAAGGTGGAGGGGAGGGGAGDGGAAGAAAAAGGVAPPGGPSFYVPADITGDYRGASDRETIDKMWGALKNAPKPPATEADYTLNVPDTLKGILNPENDKVLPMWRKIAHEEGYSQQQFERPIVKLYEGMLKAGLIEAPINETEEFLKLATGAGDRAAQIQEGQTKVLEIVDALKGAETRQEITAEVSRELSLLLGTASGVKALDFIMGRIAPNAPGPRGGGQGSTGTKSREEVLSMMQDPRFDATGDKFDKTYHAEVQQLYARLPLQAG